MIIRPRMPRILNRRSRTGILGLRSLQRSVVHVRRMIVSRLPEHAPEDIQSAIDQPLIWSDQQHLLEPPVEPVTLDSRQRRAMPPPFNRPNQSTGSSQPMQRQTEQSEPETMPKDLQAIFNLHRDKGNVSSQSSFMDQIRNDMVAQGKTPPIQSKRPGTSPTPSAPLPAQQPVQRQPADDDFPVVVEPPPPRRVRSRVEYVKPDQKSSPTVQKKSEPDSDSGDDDSSLPDSPIEFKAEEIDDLADPVDQVHVDQAIARAEAPSTPTPQVSLSRDDTPASYDQNIEADIVETPHIDDDVDRDSQNNVLDQAIAQAESPPKQPPQVSLSRDASEEVSSDTDIVEPLQADFRDESPDRAEAIDQAISKAESPSAPQVSLSRDDEADFSTVLDIPSVQAEYEDDNYWDEAPPDYDTQVDQAISQAEAPSETEQASEQPSIGQRPRKLTVSKATPPMQIQPLRIKTPSDEEDASFLESANDDSNADEGGEDNATADMGPTDEEAPAGAVQMMRDEPNYYSAPEPDSLPEQSVDLGAALFGNTRQAPFTAPPMQRQPDEGPLPTVMPPIGSTQHKTSPQSFIQRKAEVDRQAAIDAHIQRMEAPVDHDDESEYRAATEEESGLLSLLDMPADTPIQQSGGESMPNIQASREQDIDVQRAVETGEVTSEVESGDADASESESSEPNPEDVKKMANQVYSLIKRRLKIEQQRLGGRK